MMLLSSNSEIASSNYLSELANIFAELSAPSSFSNIKYLVHQKLNSSSFLIDFLSLLDVEKLKKKEPAEEDLSVEDEALELRYDYFLRSNNIDHAPLNREVFKRIIASVHDMIAIQYMPGTVGTILQYVYENNSVHVLRKVVEAKLRAIDGVPKITAGNIGEVCDIMARNIVRGIFTNMRFATSNHFGYSDGTEIFKYVHGAVNRLQLDLYTGQEIAVVCNRSMAESLASVFNNSTRYCYYNNNSGFEHGTYYVGEFISGVKVYSNPDMDDHILVFPMKRNELDSTCIYSPHIVVSGQASNNNWYTRSDTYIHNPDHIICLHREFNHE